MNQAEVYPFTSVGEHYRQRYPAWLRSLKGDSGVYAIRERGGEIVYIGESHSDRLYQTLTRHFQYWSDSFDTAGPTYERGDVQAAVILVPRIHVIRLQNELILALQPRDNRQVQDDFEPITGYSYDLDELIVALMAGDKMQIDDDIPF